MDGALPSAVGGLTGVPLVAVPTSVGYGASFGGRGRAAHDAQLLRARRGRGEHRQRLRRRAVRGPGGPADRPVIGWLDCAAGASGDMLLGALVDAGVPVETLQAAVDAVGVGAGRLRVSTVERHGIGAIKVDVRRGRTAPPAVPGPTSAALVTAAALPDPFASHRAGRVRPAGPGRGGGAPGRRRATCTSTRSGALDAIADVVGVAAGLHALGLDRLTAGPVTVGSGRHRPQRARRRSRCRRRRCSASSPKRARRSAAGPRRTRCAPRPAPRCWPRRHRLGTAAGD